MFSFGKRGRDDAAKPPSLSKPLVKTRAGLWQGLRDFFGGSALDDEQLEEFETHLLMADVGMDVTLSIVEALRRQRDADPRTALRDILVEILAPCEQPLTIGESRPFVILVVGVNGVGKTTTIGKLAAQLQAGGLSVTLAAGDTFRAAAVEQLSSWGDRLGVPVVKQAQGADSASVIFDAIQSAAARGSDVLIADTAGRLHTQEGLMGELRKIRRVIGKIDAQAPHETLLVVDGTTGQNALSQAAQFHAQIGVTGLCLTKLDGTAKGGVLFALAHRFGLPVRFIGVGETVDDLRTFRASEFVDALLPE